MLRLTRRLLLGGLSVVVGVAALAQGAAAQGANKNEITLGYSISLTGKFSTDATDTHRAYELWAEQVNKAGGIQLKGRKLPVKLKYYDDASDTNTAIRNYERLVTRDEVDLLLSPWGSGHNFAITAANEKYKIPMVLSSAAADRIFERGLKYIFGSTQLASNFYESLGDYLAANKDQVKTVAIAYENFLFTQSLHDYLLKKLASLGVKVAVDEQYPLGGQDFTSMLTKIKAANPDAFVLINIMPSSVYMTRQMGEVGFRPKLYAVNIGPMFQKEFTDTLGKSAENVVENGFWHQDLPYKGAKQYYDAFVAKYNKTPSTDAAYAYISTTILQAAIEKAGSLDREAITQALRTGKFDTVLGPYEFDDRGVNKDQLSFLVQVQNGKRTIVWPKNVSSSTLKLPY
jgi:branched-chain amino acid transport system substrate-binding protein